MCEEEVREEKFCPGCKTPKKVGEFSKDRRRKDGLRSYCRVCDSERNKQYHREHKEQKRQYRREHKEQKRAYNIERTYGITSKERDALLKAQRGKCLICGRVFAEGKKGTRSHTDHDHDTGVVRGILCNACNRGIGFLQDDPKLLQRAAVYLKIYQTTHPEPHTFLVRELKPK